MKAIAVEGMVVAALGLLSLVVLTGGDRQVVSLNASYGSQDLLGVALERRIFDGSRIWLGNLQAVDAPGVEDRLADAGHDFQVDHDNDCGLLGSVVASSDLAQSLPAGVRGETVRQEVGDRLLPRGIAFDGWVEGAGIECAVMIDSTGQVVGAGGHGSARLGYGGVGAVDSPARTWFSGVAPIVGGATVYVALEGHDGFFALPFAG